MSTSTMKDFSEKRDFIRMRVNTEISLVAEASGDSLTGICKDLSGTGMLIEADKPLDPGTMLTTSLPSQNPDFPSFDTRAKVVRCEALEQGYRLGLEIIEVNR